MNQTALCNTGERMLPESSDWTGFWEHVYRYRFALPFVRTNRVLDIACGEGYGCAALARAGVKSIVGVDVSPEACAHARAKYGINAIVGSATDIPLPNRSVDVVVSFETIEHIDRPTAFIEECGRVLDTNGTLIISTPNREVYRETCSDNPFHCAEMNEDEFVGLLSKRFHSICIYSQVIERVAPWSLRTLAAQHSPWQNIKGYWALRIASNPHLFQEVDMFRATITDEILKSDGWLSSVCNPFVVRHRARASKEEPKYLVAVARLR